MNLPNIRLHKGPQKTGGIGNNGFIIKRTLFKVRISFVACEAKLLEPLNKNNTMTSRIHPKLRSWRKIALLGVAQAVLYLIIFCIAKLIGFPVSTYTIIPIAALILCVWLLIPILFSRTTSFSRRNSVFNDFVCHFEDVGGQLIYNTFGFETYSRLYNEELSQLQCSGIEICQELLRKEECSENKDLEFHLRRKKALTAFRGTRKKPRAHKNQVMLLN